VSVGDELLHGGDPPGRVAARLLRVREVGDQRLGGGGREVAVARQAGCPAVTMQAIIVPVWVWFADGMSV
jgi:hypothetical protein